MEALPSISSNALAEWYRDCVFSEDWTSQNFSYWAELLRPYQTLQLSVLEIGSWEGRSALFFLNYLPHCRITCVDTFAGGEEHLFDPEWKAPMPYIEQRFDSNLERFKSRVEKIKADSHKALGELGIARRRFDLVYVDGSHRASDVYADAVLSWPMLSRRGILIFDDYEWPHGRDEQDRPKLGIDTFLWNFLNQYTVRSRGYQIAIQKL